MIHRGWENAEVIGKSGDKGGDIIASLQGNEYVIQVKHSSTNKDLTVDIVGDVVRAMDFYGIENGICISNRNLGPRDTLSLRNFPKNVEK